MSTPFTENVRVRVYRGFDVHVPLPSPEKVPALVELPARLVGDVAGGRRGFGQPVFWTHVLLVAARPRVSDVRDPYRGEIGGLAAVDVAAGDTVVVDDHPAAGFVCPFLVRLVQRLGRGGADGLAAYLDRARPVAGSSAGVLTNCCTTRLGSRLVATLSDDGGCSCVTGDIYMDYNPTPARWEGSGMVCGHLMTLAFWCTAVAPGDNCGMFRLGGSWAGCASTLGAAMGPSGPCSCQPLLVPFRFQSTDCCTPPAGGFFKVTVHP